MERDLVQVLCPYGAVVNAITTERQGEIMAS